MKQVLYVDVDLLDEKIKESGLPEDYIYSNLDITRQSWSNKKLGKQPFRVPEVYMLCDMLNITDTEEKAKIFYPKSKVINVLMGERI